ncbi:MAG: hypothetical protein AAB522_03300 [Patescibacteria group bacterium]
MSGEEIINTLKTKILNPIEGFLIVLATLFFLWAVVEFIAGASSEEKRTQGKRHMLWGILGLVIILGARGIINVLQNFFS